MAIHAQYQGIDFDLETATLGTWDTLELMADAQNGDMLSMVRFARVVFGKEQFDTIKAQLPNNDIPTVLDFINGAIQAAAAAKGESPKN